MNSIQVIDDYYCKKEDEISHIKHIKSISEFDKYKIFVTKKNDNQPVLMEYYTGDQDLKPFFDVEQYIDSDSTKKEIQDNIELLNTKCLFELEKIYPNKNIIELMRPYRIINKNKMKKIKISFRFIVNNVITNCIQIKQVLNDYFKNDPITLSLFDLSVYRQGSNKICMIGGVKPYDDKIDFEKMKPFEKYNSSDTHSIFDMSITYIDKDYEKYVCKIPTGPIEEEIKVMKIVEIDDDKYKEEDNKYSNLPLNEIINHLKSFRADDRNEWLYGIYCVINCAKSQGIKKKGQKDIAHLFSSICDERYDEDEVEKWLDKIFDKIRNNGYRWNFLLNWLKEDAPEYYNELFGEKVLSYADKKKEFELTHCKILYPRAYVYNDTMQDVQIMKDARDTYVHIHCVIQDKKGKDGITQFFIKWEKDPDIRRYNNKVWCPPPLISKPDDFNTWDGLDVEKNNNIDDGTGRDYWSEFLIFVKNLFGDDAVTNYILSRYAFRIQNLGLRSYVIFILYGEEGLGKSMFIQILYKIFGKYVTEIGDAKTELFSDHSMVEYKRLFICLNETDPITCHQNADKLKTRITEDKKWFNPKGLTKFEAEIVSDYDVTTNNENSIKITPSSKRRYFQVEPTDYYQGNTEFFNDMVKNIKNNPVAIKQIYQGLKSFDWKQYVPSVNFQDENYKPMTESMRKSQNMNMDKIVYFLKDVIDEDSDNYRRNQNTTDLDKITGYIKFKNNTLFNNWTNWCDDSKIPFTYNKISFGMKLSKLEKQIQIILKKHYKKTLSEDEYKNQLLYMDTILKDTHSNTNIHIKNITEFLKISDLL